MKLRNSITYLVSDIKQKPFLLLILSTLFYTCKNNNQNNTTEYVNPIPINNYTDTINNVLNREFKNDILPGFVASVFTKDSIFYLNGHGYADLTNKKPYTKNTKQSIASISKTLLAIAVMKYVEDGLLTLDDEINAILPYKIVNPKFSKTPITIRHLATHTSSISDDGNYNKAYVFSKQLETDKFPDAHIPYIEIYNQNVNMPMKDFLRKTFTDWQTPKNFISNEPGSFYEYSNIGAALLAHCLEIKTGKNYKTITEELILKPLKMTNSGWNYSKLNQSNHVTYYNEIYNPVPNYNVITYPDGGLFTTAYDLTLYMQEIINGYQGNGKLLKPETYSEMFKNQFPQLDTSIGIIWDLDISCCIGHGGNDFGVSTLAYFDTKSGIGKILLSNISIETEKLEKQFYNIYNSLFKYDSMVSKSK